MVPNATNNNADNEGTRESLAYIRQMLAELRQVLPALPASAVQTLLMELRTEGRAELKGLRRWARWRRS